MKWKIFKEFITEDWREHAGCWATFAVAVLIIVVFALALLIAKL